LVGSLPDSCVLPPGAHGSAAEEEPPVLPGYSVLGRIDAGGMVVWRVREIEFPRTLALNVMRSAASTSPRAVRRFLAEAQITGCLAHTSIVPVHAKGQLPDGRPYFTMKLVEGETLAGRLRGRPDPTAGQAELVRVFAQVCQAVAFAHSHQVVHRDLKPANVMVGSFGEVQVMDWGLAKAGVRTQETGDGYRRALAIQEKLCAEYTGAPRHRQDLAVTYHNLGRLFGERGRRPEAEDAYRTALAIRTELGAAFPAVPGYRHELAASYCDLGDLLGEFDARATEAAYLKAHSLWRQLATDFPGVAEYRHDLAASYNNLGSVLRKLDRPRDARAAYRHALTPWEALAADFPGVPSYRANLAAGQVNFANLLLHGGEPAEALGWYDLAIALLRPRVEGEPVPPTDRQFLRTAHWGRAEALDRLDRPADAVADWDAAVDLSPPQEKPTVRVARARSLVRGGQVRWDGRSPRWTTSRGGRPSPPTTSTASPASAHRPPSRTGRIARHTSGTPWSYSAAPWTTGSWTRVS
jgi:tetratricopeptide (TPR) repeat protein